MSRGREQPGGKRPMTTQFQSEDFDRSPTLSQTAWALQELQLYGTVPSRTRSICARCRTRAPHRRRQPISSMPSSRPWRHPHGTRPRRGALGPGQPLPPRHRPDRAVCSMTTKQAQRRLQREQDGSEVKSTELERLTAEGTEPVERRNCMDMPCATRRRPSSSITRAQPGGPALARW
jgi:hypothetical protein